MGSSCAMTTSSVTPPLKEEEEKEEEEEEEEEGAEGAGGVTVLIHGCFNRSWASLHRTVTALMAHITVK